MSLPDFAEKAKIWSAIHKSNMIVVCILCNATIRSVYSVNPFVDQRLQLNCLDWWMDGWMDEWMDGWIDELIDGLIDGLIEGRPTDRPIDGWIA